MRIKITATLGNDELDELVATEMRRRFGMPDAEISVTIKSWGGAEITITEPQRAVAPLIPGEYPEPEPMPVPAPEEPL